MNLTDIQENAIAVEYKKLQNELLFGTQTEIETIKSQLQGFMGLYTWMPNEKAQRLLSLVHLIFVEEFQAMNSRLPTQDNTAHFWANNSRRLLSVIETSENLILIFKNSRLTFYLDNKIEDCVKLCGTFLKQSGGSIIPPNTVKMPIYLTLPIFVQANSNIMVKADNIKSIDVDYVKGLYERTQNDFNNKHYDSVLTKCRTLLEEVFCFAIEQKNTKPSTEGNIGKLFNQVKDLYNMKQNTDKDNRVNDLINGLNKIIDSIGSIRNIGGDSHGVGSNRLTINEHHTSLYLNATTTIASFIVSVVENSNKNTRIEAQNGRL